MKLDRKTRGILFKIKKLQTKMDELHAELMQDFDNKKQSEYNILTTNVYFLKKKLARSISDSV